MIEPLIDDLVREGTQQGVVDRVIDELCAFAEEQDGNPSDPISERLYSIAHALEVAFRG